MWRTALGLIVLTVGCGSRPPMDRTAVGTGDGFHCFAGPSGRSTMCFRALKDCESKRTSWEHTGECAPAAHAICLSYLHNGKSEGECFLEEAACKRDAAAFADDGAYANISRCEEL